MSRSILALAAALALAAGAAQADTKKPAGKAKPKPAATAAAPDCPRAAYKGDPVCFGEDDGRNLPTPSAGAVPREKSDAVQIGEGVTVTGADPKDMSKPPVYINNPNPNPRKQDVGGGAAVNYKF